MSLIQQALEKAEHSQALEGLSKPALLRPETPALKPIPLPVSARPSDLTKGIFIAVLIFISFTVIAFMVYILMGTQAKRSSPKKDRGQALLSRVEARVPLLPNLALHPTFVLTGITTSEGKPLALINDQVVGVGDRVGDKALVKEIQERRVILEFQGREIKLAL